MWTPSHGRAKLKSLYSNSVPIQDVTWKTSQERWTVGTGGERGSGKSMLAEGNYGDDDNLAILDFNEIFWNTMLISLIFSHESLKICKSYLSIFSWSNKIYFHIVAVYISLWYRKDFPLNNPKLGAILTFIVVPLLEFRFLSAYGEIFMFRIYHQEVPVV